MSKPIDPGAPEARRAWLDGLPVGAVVVDATGFSNIKTAVGWSYDEGDGPEALGPDEVAHWCRDPHGVFWPVSTDANCLPMPFACPDDWTPPTPDEVRAKVETTGMTHGELGRAMGGGPGSRGTVAKWLNGSRRMGWPAWRVLCELAARHEP